MPAVIVIKMFFAVPNNIIKFAGSLPECSGQAAWRCTVLFTTLGSVMSSAAPFTIRLESPGLLGITLTVRQVDSDTTK